MQWLTNGVIFMNNNNLPSENLLLIDWFSFTLHDFSLDHAKTLLGLKHITWIDMPGARGYKDKLYFNGINIHYNGSDVMGIWVEMSGSGCRAFEDFSIVSWRTLIDECIYNNGIHITRLDMAFDDHTGVFPIDKIMEDTRNEHFVSPSRWWETVYSSKGESLYIGSPQSLIRFRFYNKAAERGFTDETHWIRLEMQLRDERAEMFLSLSDDLKYNFDCVINNYLRFVSPSPDSNKSRWPLTSYWKKFISDVPKVSLALNLGSEYNMEQIKENVFNRWGNAIDAVLQVMDIDQFKQNLANRSTKPNPKYQAAVNEYKERKTKNV